ncbi:monocarboxylate transporter [Marasmius fiardii PR-910]|nr:monocarboxylate transporter [Marasmius fiardii PR-910]
MAFHVIGMNSSYGVFQQFYTSTQTNIKDAQGQDALVSLAGTVGTGLTWSGSIFVNPLISSSRLSIKIVALSGAFFMSLGLFLASFATKLWHLYLTQALLYGLGASMYYFPILAVTPLYFDRHRGFAMGIVLAGSSLGGLVFASVQQWLLDHHGIQWSLRILGIWNFAVGIPVSMVIQRHPSFRSGETSGRRWINTSVLRKGTFWFQALGAFLQAGGNVVPIYYMVAYSVSVLSLSPSTGSMLLSVNSGVNCLSRVAMGIIADYVGRQNTLIGGVVLSALSVFALWYSAAKTRFIAFVIVYGIFAGGYNALLPTTIVEIYGLQNYATVNGNLLFIRGLGSLFGAPLAGVILGSHARIIGMGMSGINGKDKLEMKFNDVVVYDGALLVVSALCVVYVRWLDAVEKRKWKWMA